MENYIPSPDSQAILSRIQELCGINPKIWKDLTDAGTFKECTSYKDYFTTLVSHYRYNKEAKEIAAKAKLAEARKGEGILKMKQTKMDCINIQQKAQAEAAKAETLATLTTLSEKSIQNAKSDLLGIPAGTSAASSNKNLLLYAGLGVGAIVLILLLRKK